MVKKNREYWKKRFEQIEQIEHSKGVQSYAEIEKLYQKAQRQIESKIEAWYGRFADNNGVDIAQARKILSAKQLAELKWDVQEYIRYGQENAISGMWAKQLENASAKYHISRLEAIKLQMQQQVEQLFGNQLDTIDQTMRGIYKDGFYRTAFEIQKGFGVGWDFGALDEKTIAKVIGKPWAIDGKNFSDRIWQNKQKLVNELNTTFTQGIILGQDPQKTIDKIAKKLNTSKNNAGRLIMTEQAFFSETAQHDSFKELDVELYEIVATLDSITSEICQGMDGKVFKMSEWKVGETAPPFHVNCRTTTVPAFNDEFDLIGERAARGEDGKTYYVPANMKYEEWKKTFVDGGTKEGLKPTKPDDTIKDTPKSKGIDDCKSTQEVVDLFKSKTDWFYEIERKGKKIRSVDGMDLKDVDLESAKAIYRPFEMLFDKFPDLKGKLNAVSASRLGSYTYAQCMVGLGHGGITVNTKFYSNYEHLAKHVIKDEQSGFHPKGIAVPESIVMHELGHAIDDYLTNTLCAAGMNGWKPKKVSAMLRPKVMRAAGFKIGDIRKEVSGYATKDCLEWFAECFAEYMLSENPRPVAREFGKQLEELINEKVKGAK